MIVNFNSSEASAHWNGVKSDSEAGLQLNVSIKSNIIYVTNNKYVKTFLSFSLK